ncbi:MAG: hypothetical protein EA394_01630 [Bacteroidia bacterium]|nr:MAG: hypothetical protein EA394_01630 [Bacteroidia bacterium]
MHTFSAKIPGDLIRPAIRTAADGMREVKPGTPFRQIKKILDSGYNCYLTGTYGFALSVHSWLKKESLKLIPIVDYAAWRQHKQILHEYQSRVWIKISKGRPNIHKAPQNPWLSEFFSGYDDFFMGFADFLGMNGARQWYERGIQYPVVNHRLFPFYGVYFPTRFDHLCLFDRWISSEKDFRRALDIGTGCGILSFIMRKQGVSFIHATDTNPNAIFGLMEELHRHGIMHGDIIFPEQADLFGSFVPGPGDLVVFNPPWIPGKAETALDSASYYPDGFFERFFNEIRTRCIKGTTIAILFSDFARVAGITSRHPIEEALQQFSKDVHLLIHDKKPVSEQPGKYKSWIADIRQNEHVELFVLKKN